MMGADFDSKDLAKRSVTDKILKDRDYEIVINSKYDMISTRIRKHVRKFYWHNLLSGTSANEELAQELHKPVIKKFKRMKSVPDLKIISEQQI